MALYDNKHWLLSHIRNSFISTDDTGMCEVVMSGEKVTKTLADKLDSLPVSESSDDDDDDLEHESYEIQLDMNFGLHRQRSNTAAKLEKMDQARKKAAKIKLVKWETNKMPLNEEAINDLFPIKEVVKKTKNVTKSLLSEQLEKYTNMPQNPYMEYAKFDGTAQVGVTTRKYKIFLTMLPEEHRNYPIDICCIASAKIQDLIGLICLKSSHMHGEYIKLPVNYYGLYITEENGEVDHDLPCLDPKECVVKYGFTCLGFVEHKNPNKSVSFVPLRMSPNESMEEVQIARASEEAKQTENLMAGHKTAMEAPLYKSYKVYILNKMRGKVEIHLGISGEKIEIDPVQQKSSKFALVRQKAVSHNMDSVAWCEIVDNKSTRSSFRVVYCLSFSNLSSSEHVQVGATSPSLQTSASFKHYDFEAEHEVAEEIVQKINLILKLRSSSSRKEYLAAKERKLYRRKSFTSK